MRAIMKTAIRTLMLTGLLAMASAAVTPALAEDDDCTGTVHGLAKHYNFATGAGFLAVRAKPKTSAKMIDQLFNGNEVPIYGRQGNWYKVETDDVVGWAYYKWIENDCDY
jgi:Bacterial SH3 domain